MIENYDKLDYNRKVDMLVVIHVMGWKGIAIQEIGSGSDGQKYMCVGTDKFNGQGYIPLYSTLLTSAWDIVRKFDYMYLFRSKYFKEWECKLVGYNSDLGIDHDGKHYAWAETEQLAICYAGLKAVGFDVKSFLKEEGKV